eukprot:CAMPEP_0118900428 /NCGR_PEP_ID=MMETSP1166-20130328/6548_1 /TAXON_ID=1104430 /ORGANISM="Chrysoreinhardia sp, Strain CCMP3193" /LENGTH=256 /DNA_ID=CAMNT_0006839567 /DNA_START=84 /DNA_END=854 /DNA_ORIENTATION=-
MPIDYSKWAKFGAEEEEEEAEPGTRKAMEFFNSTKGKALTDALGSYTNSEDPSAWARGLSPEAQYAWLCDCYGLRVVDRAKREDFSGILRPRATVESVCRDFLVFCRLGVQSMTIPMGWNWEKFLGPKRLEEIKYPVEEEDFPNERNVFAPMKGGRSMRLTATAIYVAAPGDPSPLERSVLRACEMAFTGKENDVLYRPLGGRKLWDDFYANFKADPGPNVLGGSILKPGDPREDEEVDDEAGPVFTLASHSKPPS